MFPTERRNLFEQVIRDSLTRDGQVRGSAVILQTNVFLDGQRDVRFATQSGPMLAIENQLHPALILGSGDKSRCSGVGVCEGGQVRFAKGPSTTPDTAVPKSAQVRAKRAPSPARNYMMTSATVRIS